MARLRAPGPVDAVGLSADGRYAVLSSDPPSCDPENADDGLEVDDEEAPTAEVRFWDLTLDALAGSDTAQMNDVFHVALSPDGALASLSGEDRFIVLRCPSGEFVASLGTDLDHMVACGNVFSSSFSADSRTIAFGVELGILSVRGIERTRSNFSTTSSPADANIAPQRRGCIGAVAWAPDGKRIAAGCDRGVISFHRVDGGVGPSVCELKGEVTALHVLDDELIAGTDEGRLFRIPLEAFGSLRGGSVHRAARPVRIVPRDHGRPADAKSKLFRPDDRVRLMANPTLIGIVRVFNAGADSVQVEWDHAPGHVEAAHSWELDLIVPERP